MRLVISTEKLPVKIWTDFVEDGAMEQIRNLANLPFAFKHIAIMPDVHQGYGMPIGGVLATKNVIIPNAVGVDIGCGMCAVKTSLTELSQEQIKKIFGGSKEYQGGIRTLVPVGFSHHGEKQDENLMPQGFSGLVMPVIEKEYTSALKQIGTLGGGNHFIELQKGSDGYIWIMIHSGSRNLGKQVAEHYNNLAIKLNEKWHSLVPSKWELAFLPLDSDEGQAYINEMNYCVEFAFANRKLMMDRCKQAVSEVVDTQFNDMINIAHNYARLENHFGENVMVHRKGATSARAGETGIIPGSMGTKSYIVSGKGEAEAFTSCSHGSGRKLSRSKAIKEINLEETIKNLEEQGIVHGIRHKNDLEEAPEAYKDIDEVMKNEQDLVDVLVELKPIGVIKG